MSLRPVRPPEGGAVATRASAAPAAPHVCFVATAGGVVRLDADEGFAWVSGAADTALGPLRPAHRPLLDDVLACRGPRAPSGQNLPSGERLRVLGAVPGTPESVAGRLAAGATLGGWLPASEVYTRLAATERERLAVLPVGRDLAARDPGSSLVVTPRVQRVLEVLFRALLVPRRGVLLKGVSGVGKSTAVEALAAALRAMEVPGRLQGLVPLAMGIELFMPASSSDEERQKADLRRRLARSRTVLVVDEASRLVDRYGNTAALDNVLLFVDEGARLLLLSDKMSLLEKRRAFVRRFVPCYLRPADEAEASAIAGAVGARETARSGVVLAPDATTRAARLARALPTALPAAAVDLVTHALARAEMLGASDVTPADVDDSLRELLAQGDEPPAAVTNAAEFVMRMRAAGYLGHARLLEVFGARLVAAAEARYCPGADARPWLAGVLVGPPGSGKTTFWRCLAGLVASSAAKVMVVRGSAYREPHAVARLRGSPPGYVAFEQGSGLGNFVRQAPDGLLVVEEPELAHPNAIEVLLEVLDGEFETGDGERVSTAGLAVLVCTNAGCERPTAPFGFAPGGDEVERERTVLVAALEGVLDPRLVDRLRDDVFHVPRLGAAALRNLVRTEAARLGERVGRPLRITDEAARQVVAEGLAADRRGSARAVLAAFRRLVERPARDVVRAGASGDALVALVQGEAVVVRAVEGLLDELPAATAAEEEDA